MAVSDAREPLFLVKAASGVRPRAAVPTVFAGNSALVQDSTIRLAGGADGSGIVDTTLRLLAQ